MDLRKDRFQVKTVCVFIGCINELEAAVDDENKQDLAN